MCDVQGPTENLIISSSEECSVKKNLIDLVNEDENDKDNTPEVLEKMDACEIVSKKTLEKLSDGLLSPYVNDLKKSSTSLKELMRNQNIVIETLEQESSRVVEALNIYCLDDMFARIKHYQAKAVVLKKEMLSIHERTLKLKKRAMRLQQQKQKEALQKELHKDRELERDKQLAPRIATKSSSEK